MPTIEARCVFAVLGPLLLVLGLLRCLGPWRNKVQGRTWMIVGTLFSALAAWLFWAHAPH